MFPVLAAVDSTFNGGLIMLGILGAICILASLVCQIIVVIKMFQTAGVVQGIIGLLCGLWAFIWGWMNSDKVGKNIMLLWTLIVILATVFNIAGGGFSYSFGDYR
jgi:hypothetical protein